MPAEQQTEILEEPPGELVSMPLRRLGEGVGKIVYASPHWVVKRERSPTEVVAIVILWNVIRRLKRVLPQSWFQGPSRQIRFLRVLVQGAMAVVPKSLWYTTHIEQAWKLYHKRNVRGERLAETHLTGTELIPKRVQFPPARVKVRGWPGSLTVSEATERVDSILFDKLRSLAREGSFDEIELWLERLLETRQAGWQRGLFSVDAHLKNFGVCGDRIVLLDTGGLTNRWQEIQRRLAFEESVERPHVQLGLGAVLEPRPDIADRFDSRWKATVNPDVVRENWAKAI